MSRTFVLLIVLSLGCAACHTPLESRKELVAVDSLIDAQVHMLVQKKTTLQKEALVDGRVEKKILQISDSTSWAQELDVFRQLKLVNSPIFFDKYHIEDDLPDVNSNLRILSITANEPVPIKTLKVYYQDTPVKIRRVEGSYTESNFIFSGSRNMLMEFQDIEGTLSLIRFQIEGGQRMILGDSVMYTILGEIAYQ